MNTKATRPGWLAAELIAAAQAKRDRKNARRVAEGRVTK